MPGRSAGLRYTLQCGHGRFWRTVKAYNADKFEFAYVSELMFRLVCHGMPDFCRILIMPFNVLAETSEPDTPRPRHSRYLHEIHTQP